MPWVAGCPLTTMEPRIPSVHTQMPNNCLPGSVAWWRRKMRSPDEQLQGYLEWLDENYGDQVDFVILYGSRARGPGRRGSDFDLLIGLKGPSERRFLDRLYDFAPNGFPLMEPK